MYLVTLRNFRVILLIILFVTLSDCKDKKICNTRRFHKGIKFGAATAAYQVEGAWDTDGKAESIWDRFVQNETHRIKGESTGKVSSDSYHHVERDIEMMRELGLDFYKFSLSWPRILPTAFPDLLNEAGVQYYNNLINDMLKYNLAPMVTLYHWDLPQKLQELGGWTNPHIVDWFSDYARVAFTLFGPRVKYWITINEPHQICYHGYGVGNFPPTISIPGIAEYMCSRNILMAHARVYHIYDEEFRPYQGGNIFIALRAEWYEPKSINDIQAAEFTRTFAWEQYAYPIFSMDGDFPPSLKKGLAEISALKGFPRSRLPELTLKEIDYIKGTSDFFGLIHFTTFIVHKNKTRQRQNDFNDVEVLLLEDNKWSTTSSGSATVTGTAPWGFHKLLNYIRNTYGNPTVYICGNGFATHEGVDDHDRIDYYKQYITAMQDAMDEGSDVAAYTVWSLMDGFEWLNGFNQRFGLYEVDFDDPARTRTPRLSAFVYKEIISKRMLSCDRDPYTRKNMVVDYGH